MVSPYRGGGERPGAHAIMAIWHGSGRALVIAMPGCALHHVGVPPVGPPWKPCIIAAKCHHAAGGGTLELHVPSATAIVVRAKHVALREEPRQGALLLRRANFW